MKITIVTAFNTYEIQDTDCPNGKLQHNDLLVFDTNGERVLIPLSAVFEIRNELPKETIKEKK